MVMRRGPFLAAGGYLPDLAWYTDWFAYLTIAFRHGLVHVPDTLAVRTLDLHGAYSAGAKSRERNVAALGAFLDRITSPAYADVAPLFRRSGAATYFGADLIRAGLLLGATTTLVFGAWLAFAIRHLGCVAGIMVTASHNPVAHNGLKFYRPDGELMKDDEAPIQLLVAAGAPLSVSTPFALPQAQRQLVVAGLQQVRRHRHPLRKTCVAARRPFDAARVGHQMAIDTQLVCGIDHRDVDRLHGGRCLR